MRHLTVRNLARLLEAIHRGEDIDHWRVYEFAKALGETRLLAGTSMGHFADSIQRALMYHGGAAWFAKNREAIQEGMRDYFASDWPAIHDIRREEAHAS